MLLQVPAWAGVNLRLSSSPSGFEIVSSDLSLLLPKAFCVWPDLAAAQECSLIPPKPGAQEHFTLKSSCGAHGAEKGWEKGTSYVAAGVQEVLRQHV